jgi:hypothetical protein
MRKAEYVALSGEGINSCKNLDKKPGRMRSFLRFKP